MTVRTASSCFSSCFSLCTRFKLMLVDVLLGNSPLLFMGTTVCGRFAMGSSIACPWLGLCRPSQPLGIAWFLVVDHLFDPCVASVCLGVPSCPPVWLMYLMYLAWIRLSSVYAASVYIFHDKRVGQWPVLFAQTAKTRLVRGKPFALVLFMFMFSRELTTLTGMRAWPAMRRKLDLPNSTTIIR